MVACDPAKLVKEVKTLMEGQASKKELDLEVKLENIPKCIYTDPVRLRQCLLNLLSNAVKFTQQGYVYINVTAEGKGKEWIRFDVEDSGPGIPADKQEMIFESFSQAETDSAGKLGGTGLGLAITRRLTRLLGELLTCKASWQRDLSFPLPSRLALTWTSMIQLMLRTK